MFLQVLNELHGGFRRIGVTEIPSEIHSVMMTGALREKFPDLALPRPLRFMIASAMIERAKFPVQRNSTL
jgi:hypothetical protein